MRELLDILDTYTRGSREGTQRRKEAGAKLRALSEEKKEAVGCTFVNDIVEELAAFLEVDETDSEKRSLMQTIDTNVVVMNADTYIYSQRESWAGMAETSPGCYLRYWYKSTCFTGTKVQVLTQKEWRRHLQVATCFSGTNVLALLVQKYKSRSERC